ncbi:hypothetical protein ETB97_012106 [Aspergillus alliaceus]|uniref:Uncharacterized protein n=1 Tax=Petromyces alliaceus TaxID=209559 RepID=A0A5N6GBQ6_PETAA|nr:uncharacterized protein BDW43DRAFT_262100 [Aspergillus alliaceus]KAB8238590.1 hypothetical protein BDW43DRAFT_262100 [Aspergillus alliaceus]KAF5862122.1 hypothetical protein ETB97_012106 [Aspergillus burnettii]
MPATARPNTDYERWLQNHNPDVEFHPSPQYGPHHGSRSKKFPPFQTPKTDRPRNPFAGPQIRFSPTDKELGSSSRETSNSPIFMLLFLFIILVAVAYARTQLAHSSRARPAARRSEKQ